MSKSFYHAGREYMERFVKARDKAKKASDQYERFLDGLRPKVTISADKIQSGRVSDPTAANALKSMLLRAKYDAASVQYDRAVDDLDHVLKQCRKEHRLVIVLYYIDGRTIKELSGILVKKGGGSYTPDSISNLKHAALVEIGKIIKKEARA